MDFLQDYIEHSWGKKPEQKKEKKSTMQSIIKSIRRSG